MWRQVVERLRPVGLPAAALYSRESIANASSGWPILHRGYRLMPRLFLTSLLLCVFASSSPAQLKTDPLGKQLPGIRGAACSATESSSCAEAAAKILPQVMGPSPMAENLRRLTDEVGGRVTGSPEMAKAVDWALAAFRAAGIEAHTEKYTLPVTWSEGDTRLDLLGPVKFP